MQDGVIKLVLDEMGLYFFVVQGLSFVVVLEEGVLVEVESVLGLEFLGGLLEGLNVRVVFGYDYLFAL